VNGSLIRDRVLTALDLWLAADRSNGVRAVLRATDPDEYRDRVRDAIVAGDRPGLVKLSGEPAALEQPARFAAVLGEFDSVPADRRRALLENALRDRPADLGVLMTLGQTYRNDRANAAERVRWYQAAAATHPENQAARNNLGLALMHQGNLNGAITTLREVLRRDPKFEYARTNLVSAHIRKKDLDGAVSAAREAVELQPESAQAHYELGRALGAKRDPAGAMESLQTAVRLDPDLGEAHLKLGGFLSNVKQDFDRAIWHLDEAIRVNPNDPVARHDLGIVRTRKGDPDGALAAHRAAVRIDPDYAPSHFQLGVLLCDRKKDYDAAITHFLEALRVNPKQADAHHNLGIARECKDDLKGAAAAYRAAIAVEPDFPEPHFRLGSILAQTGDLDEALHTLQEATRLNPKHSSAQANLAWLLATGPDQLRDGKQAVDRARRACELTGWKDPVVVAILAGACAEAGEFDRAVEYQKKALSSDEYVKRNGETGREKLALYERKKPYRDPAFVPRERGPRPREVGQS